MKVIYGYKCLKEKHAYERRLYHYFTEMMRLCHNMRRRYACISKKELEKILGGSSAEEADLDPELLERYPHFMADVECYMKLKSDFQSCAADFYAFEDEVRVLEDLWRRRRFDD